ncbi:MAG: hypothetical protein AB1483_07965 [Candidatus Zixiibacteriota bacterium]
MAFPREIPGSFVPQEKTLWHSYSLQLLVPNQFAKIANRILSGRYNLITPRTQERVTTVKA